MLASTLLPLLPLLVSLPFSNAATADQWRSRSIYQLVTDRFAPATPNAPCNADDRRYCGGTWQTIISKLDYIQGLGYDAVWISPTGLNLEGDTVHGQAYHAYWVTDPTQPNPHFGSGDDLKALSKALHDRGMYLMADIAINAFASLTNDISDASLANAAGGKLLFKHRDNFHAPCNIDYSNWNSIRTCWLANNNVYLMDINQDNTEVKSMLSTWIKSYVSEFGIDGLRLDASKHMDIAYQASFCKDAGVYCIGEVYADDQTLLASYTKPGGIDSVFGFTMYYGFINSFTGSNPKPLSDLANRIGRLSAYTDASLIGSFLENQDLPRINSLESDKSKVYNAIVGSFLFGGIPAMYYGLEQDMSDGPYDPRNREALWLYNGYATSGNTYKRIAALNKIRKALGKDATWLKATAKSVATQTNDIAMTRQGTLIVLTNRGASGSGTWKIRQSGFSANTQVKDLLSCSTLTTDGSGALTVTWTTGQPFVFVTSAIASSRGLCGSSSSGTLLASSEDSATDSGADSTGASADSTLSSNAPSTTTTSSLASTSNLSNPVVSSTSSTSSIDSTSTSTADVTSANLIVTSTTATPDSTAGNSSAVDDAEPSTAADAGSGGSSVSSAAAATQSGTPSAQTTEIPPVDSGARRAWSDLALGAVVAGGVAALLV